jgi:hypothetical protein
MNLLFSFIAAIPVVPVPINAYSFSQVLKLLSSIFIAEPCNHLHILALYFYTGTSVYLFIFFWATRIVITIVIIVGENKEHTYSRIDLYIYPQSELLLEHSESYVRLNQSKLRITQYLLEDVRLTNNVLHILK